MPIDTEDRKQGYVAVIDSRKGKVRVYCATLGRQALQLCLEIVMQAKYTNLDVARPQEGFYLCCMDSTALDTINFRFFLDPWLR